MSQLELCSELKLILSLDQYTMALADVPRHLRTALRPAELERSSFQIALIPPQVPLHTDRPDVAMLTSDPSRRGRQLTRQRMARLQAKRWVQHPGRRSRKRKHRQQKLAGLRTTAP